MHTLNRDNLKKLLDNQEPLYLVNVLGNREFSQAHIPGSQNVPVADKNFVQEVEQLTGDRDARIVVYCASFSCTASPNAASKLDHAGFTRVYDYEGGVKDWQDAGYPLEGES